MGTDKKKSYHRDFRNIDQGKSPGNGTSWSFALSFSRKDAFSLSGCSLISLQ
jgi:hypothetical protein